MSLNGKAQRIPPHQPSTDTPYPRLPYPPPDRTRTTSSRHPDTPHPAPGRRPLIRPTHRIGLRMVPAHHSYPQKHHRHTPRRPHRRQPQVHRQAVTSRQTTVPSPQLQHPPTRQLPWVVRTNPRGSCLTNLRVWGAPMLSLNTARSHGMAEHGESLRRGGPGKALSLSVSSCFSCWASCVPPLTRDRTR